MDAMKHLMSEAVSEAMLDAARKAVANFGGIREVSVTRPTKLLTQIKVLQEGRPVRFFEVKLSEPTT